MLRAADLKQVYVRWYFSYHHIEILGYVDFENQIFFIKKSELILSYTEGILFF